MDGGVGGVRAFRRGGGGVRGGRGEGFGLDEGVKVRVV